MAHAVEERVFCAVQSGFSARSKSGTWNSIQSLECTPSKALCVTTETRHIDRLGQLGEFEQDSNTDSEQESLVWCVVQHPKPPVHSARSATQCSFQYTPSKASRGAWHSIQSSATQCSPHTPGTGGERPRALPAVSLICSWNHLQTIRHGTDPGLQSALRPRKRVSVPKLADQ